MKLYFILFIPFFDRDVFIFLKMKAELSDL